MKLYDFLFQKGVLRKFKRNWLRYRYYHRASKSIQDKEFNDWRAYLNEDCRHIENTYNTLKQLYNSKRTNKTKRDE